MKSQTDRFLQSEMSCDKLEDDTERNDALMKVLYQKCNVKERLS